MIEQQLAAMKQALEALEDCYSTGDYNEYQFYDEDLVNAAKKALREALAEQPNITKYLEKDNSEQPAQQQNLQDLWHKVWPDAGAFVRASADDLTQFAKAISTSPQPAQPSKPLTDEQIENLWQNTSPYYDHQDFARSIEAAHGIMSGTDGKGDA